MTDIDVSTYEQQQVEITKLKKQLNRFEAAGVLDLGFTQQVIGGSAKAAGALAELKYLMERDGRGDTKSFSCLLAAIQAMKEFKLSVTPSLLMKLV